MARGFVRETFFATSIEMCGIVVAARMRGELAEGSTGGALFGSPRRDGGVTESEATLPASSLRGAQRRSNPEPGGCESQMVAAWQLFFVCLPGVRGTVLGRVQVWFWIASSLRSSQ